MFKPTPAAELLRSLIEYNSKTGECHWLKNRGGGVRAGDLVPPLEQIKILGYRYILARVIWKIQTGEDCPVIVDHKNRVGWDNRWCNLRAATRSQNNSNAKVREDNGYGEKGISRYQWDKSRWSAFVRHNKVLYRAGPFSSRREARSWRRSKARELHGEFFSG